MKYWLVKIRDILVDSFWFLPAVMAFIAGGFALGVVAFDHAIGSDWVKNIGWIWSGGADGARAVLSIISGSVMTVISIVFSLTITTLAQTSLHYGPRVLRNFTSDRKVQLTLGTFIATFVYCLLVLRTVRSADGREFIPYLSVNIGVVLALASLAVLIFFIHYISQSIQAENLIADVGRDFHGMLTVLFPDRIVKGDHQRFATKDICWEGARRLDAEKTGYLLRVDDDQLMKLAVRNDLQIKLEKRPGEFVPRNMPLLHGLPSSRMTEEIMEALRGCFNLGDHRTPYQDALYSIQQLVEIAAHALSPSINEPFTTLTCIDWLGASLRSIARLRLPSGERYDKNGCLRVILRPLTFKEFVHIAFDQIRLYGAGNPAVIAHLLHTIASLAPDIQRMSDRRTLLDYVRIIGASASHIPNKADQDYIAEEIEKTLQALAKE